MAKTGMSSGYIRTLWKAARAIAESENNPALSTQEGIRLAFAAWQHAETIHDLKIFMSQWAARTSKGRNAIAEDTFSRLISSAWSELCRARGDK